MEINSKEEFDRVKLALKIGLKTLLNCFIGIMFSLSIIFVALPRFSLKINNAIGLNKIKELNYQMIYSRSKKITDLYNVIIYEASVKNYSKELNYIDKILKRDDYVSFCDALDKASLKSIKNKNMLPYSVNVNGYLTGRKVICLYNLNTNGIETFVYRQTKEGRLTEYVFSTYVDLVYKDSNLTDSLKIEKLSLLMGIIDVSGKKLDAVMDSKIDDIKIALNVETEREKQIALQYSLVRIYRSRYYLADKLNKQSEKESYDNLFVEAKNKLNEMIDL